jgi:tetratricopeptide (TPR) repeat protein
VRRFANEYPTYPIFACVRAHMEAELGCDEEAATRLRELGADGFAALPFDEEWLVSMSLLAETALRVGDAECASAIYERLLPYDDRIAVSYPEIAMGAVARYLGLAAIAMGHPAEAERHLRRALAINERIGARPFATRVTAERMLAARANR